MTLLEQLQKELLRLPLKKQGEVLDFILFLQNQNTLKHQMKIPLRKHPTFSSWRGRNIDALEYQTYLRSQWEG